jgi:hypothetical protein
VNHAVDGETADDVETSDLSTTEYRTYEGGELVEGGTVSYLVHFDPEQTRLATGVSDVATITYPISNPANGSPATRVFDTYLNSYSENGEINGLIEANITLKVASKPIFTPETV